MLGSFTPQIMSSITPRAISLICSLNSGDSFSMATKSAGFISPSGDAARFL